MTSPKPLNDAELESLLSRALAMPDAPPAWVAAAVGAWRERPRVELTQALRALVEQVTAVLRFDSWAPSPLPVGVRGVPTATRHLLFSTQGRDIDLRITPHAGDFAVAGQVLGPDDSGSVELSADGTDVAGSHSAALDELGEFRLDRVPGGIYRMTLRLGGDEIALPPIAVGDRPS
jgi:hypothetical protein